MLQYSKIKKNLPQTLQQNLTLQFTSAPSISLG
ncbi:hypothetical protein PRIPAC_96539 [Pristionchus pacificus]|nr:hypothetical protein PRIPAC_96539 [Pristionchus pacificus]